MTAPKKSIGVVDWKNEPLLVGSKIIRVQYTRIEKQNVVAVYRCWEVNTCPSNKNEHPHIAGSGEVYILNPGSVRFMIGKAKDDSLHVIDNERLGAIVKFGDYFELDENGSPTFINMSEKELKNRNLHATYLKTKVANTNSLNKK